MVMFGFRTKKMRATGLRLMEDFMKWGGLRGALQFEIWSTIIKTYRSGQEHELKQLIDLVSKDYIESCEGPKQNVWDSRKSIEAKLSKYFSDHPKGKEERHIISFATPVRLMIIKRRKEGSPDLSRKSALAPGQEASGEASSSPIDLAEQKRDVGMASSNIEDILSPGEEIDKEIAFLSNQLMSMNIELDSAKRNGIYGTINSLTGEIETVSKKVELLKDRKLIVERGYEYRSRSEFITACEGGFIDTWETVISIDSGAIRPNPVAQIKIPISRHSNYREAVESNLFSEIAICRLHEDNGIDEEIPDYIMYYLFGTSFLDQDSAFLIVDWSSEDSN